MDNQFNNVNAPNEVPQGRNIKPVYTSDTTYRPQQNFPTQTPYVAAPPYAQPTQNSQPAQNAQPTQGYNYYSAYVPKPKLRVPVTARDAVFAIIFFVLSIVSVDLGLFGGFNMGYSISTVLVTVFMCVYACRGNRFTLLGGYFAICAVAIAATLTVYNSAWSKFIQVIAVWVLLTLALIDFTKSGQYSQNGWHGALDVLRVMIVTPFERIETFIGSVCAPDDNNSSKRKRYTAALTGLACAVPALIIILPLLVASDAAFEQLLKNTIFSDLPRLFGSIVLGCVFFLLVFTSIFAAAKKIVVGHDDNKTTKIKGINPIAVNSFFGVVSFVYAVYILSQMTYFFSAFSGLLPENFTVAEYARRGFFEMTAICAINLILVGIALILTRKNERGEVPRTTKGLCVFIITFSLAIIFTVCAKLTSYMNNFGLTKMRVYTTIFSVMLAVVFICALIRLCVRRFPYFKVCAAIIAAIGVAVSVADVNTVIAYYNYEGYHTGVVNNLDVEYYGYLGDAGVPYLVDLLDEPQFKQEAANSLIYVAYDYGYYEEDYNNDDKWVISSDIKLYDDENDFRSYNIGHIKAAKLIKENWKHIAEISNASW